MMALQLPLDLQFRPAFGRGDFFVTASNQDAIAMVDNWPASWGGFPALTIFGAPGSGKSHLAAVWAAKAGAHILNADDFLQLNIEEMIGSIHHLAIDRVDLLLGNVENEQNIFHVYNAVSAAGKTMLLTSHYPPAGLVFSLRDLESRLRASSAVQIHQPDDDLLAYVFAKRMHDRGLSVTEKLSSYVAGRMERTWEAMDALVAALTSRATAEKKGITQGMVREILEGHVSHLD